MIYIMYKKILVVICMIALIAGGATAQSVVKKKERKGEFYFSWGYNKEWYTQSDLYISQPGLGNDYVLKAVKASDKPGWDEDLLGKAISIPQYNYRIGYIFNKKKGLGFEINFDHTKYIIYDQMVHMEGTYQGKSVNTNKVFARSNTDSTNSYYFLNNGANFLLFNIVKRSKLYETQNHKVKVDFLGKAGIGPVIPHVENCFWGVANEPHFQIGGWNVGLEACIRTTFFNSFYLEYCNKIDYARYSGLKINSGTAHQAFGTYEMILNLGYTLPMGRREN